ncbi:sugar ABC transporter ATP-binding protein [Atribacter laminatus]|uniref:Autoinducer 2 import ATP-binding protein LsrA n=1 Tax=Atribacter laminatus TaxID=2847778 RepID=A0A7T1AKA9_ATRLM|nr:sugar ABC transporter ATP-binding protein [Atribacter laminatus]QPM67492.1 Ribose import ATP-binding protein RbsA [Atribacter laminatus]
MGNNGGTAPVLEAKKIIKKYPGVEALKGINFDLKPGEVRGLLGKNGAGKSTFIKIISGLEEKTSGELFYFGEKSEIRSVQDSERLGFRFISQEPALMEDLSIAENIVFREKELHGSIKRVNWKSLYKFAKERLEIFNLTWDPKLEVRYLTIAEKQMLLIIREIFSTGAKIIALDEVTVSLSLDEIRLLYDVMRKQKKIGQSFIYISHEIDEIFQICDSVTVIRDGEVVLSESIDDINHNDLKKAIVGKDIEEKQKSDELDVNVNFDEKQSSESVLCLNNVSNTKLKNIHFNLYQGEVLGIYGLRASGRTELLKTIYGLLPVQEGCIMFKGQNIVFSSTNDLINKGIGFVPEDRSEGLFLGRPVDENLLISSTQKHLKPSNLFIDRIQEKRIFEEVAEKFQIKAHSPKAEIDYLSGGNKQKVMFGRCLAAHSQLYLVDEGTKGIDIGAKNEIYKIIRQLVAGGTSVIFTSSDLEEIIHISDRIMVLHEGKIAQILLKKEATKEKLLHYADGAVDSITEKEG